LLSEEEKYGFIDAVDWESIERQGQKAIERWISGQLKDTTVSVVLIGAETADRPWVRYEIVESWNRGNGIVGIWIQNIKDQDSQTDVKGRNPLDEIKLSDGTPLSSVCKTYDWVLNDGRNNLGKWVEEAFKVRGSTTGSKSLLRSAVASAGLAFPDKPIVPNKPAGFGAR
jgi:hypothetical protein